MNKTTRAHDTHWYGPMVEAEHRAVHFLADDITHTEQDIGRFERRMKNWEARSPNLALILKGIAFMALLLTMLAVQAYYGYSRF